MPVNLHSVPCFRRQARALVCCALPVLLPLAGAPAAAAELDEAFRLAVAVQTLLDRENFSPGCIDGSPGRRTREALAAWQLAHGREPTGEADAETLDALGKMDSIFVWHRVSTGEVASLAPVPATWREKAAAPRLGYATVVELVAEKYHASEGCIRRMNPQLGWPDPPAGTLVLAPNPYPAARPRAATVTIYLSRKIIQAADADGRVVGFFPCSIARDVAKRPAGEFRTVNAAQNPDYVYNPALFSEDPESSQISGKLVIPSGPNNPVGVAWIGLDIPGYGMHGTPHPEDIGKTESHGCFRLTNWNAEKLLRMISVGTPVRIQP